MFRHFLEMFFMCNIDLFIFVVVGTGADIPIIEDIVNYHPAWNLIPTDNCGLTRYNHMTARIINGKEAKLGQFPWIARLGYKKFFRHKIFNCGGSLITSKYVLTAGHCGTEHEIVRLGEHDTTKKLDCIDDNTCTTYQDIDIEKHIFNDFEEDTLRHDICLILLAEPAQFNEFVRPVCLPRGKVLRYDFLGKKVHVAGWGYTNSSSHTVATILQYVSVPIVESSECNEIYTNELISSQCCAGYPHGKDSCNGDSGGPMTKSINLDGDSRNYLVGIVSYGRIDCGAGPAVYTLVSKYILRILDNITQ